MQTSTRHFAANAILESGEELHRFLRSDTLPDLLRNTHVDWAEGILLNAPPQVRDLLLKLGGIAEDRRTLTGISLRLLGKLQIDLEAATRNSVLSEKFEILGTVAQGSSSIAVKAINKNVGRTVILKILRPTRPDLAIAAIRKLGQLEDIPHLIAPIDSIDFVVMTDSGDAVRLYCIVFPFVPALTLDQYLESRPPIAPYFFEAFIRQVGGVLEQLEARGMEHGDLHGANILVSSEQPSLQFTVIDPSPSLGITSPYGRDMSDFEWFKEHLGRALLVLQRNLPSISIQKHLGPRLFSIINLILQTESPTFRELIRSLHDNTRFDEWLRARAAFVAAKFQQPKPLGLLRWEEMADPAQAVELFEPFPELFRRVKLFGNSLIVGARGSGKSTYLAALAYFPGAPKKLVEPSEIFGVLFSCRQGEFKQFSSDFIHYDAFSRVALKHVLILKIVRRVLSTLGAACERGDIDSTGDMSALYTFIETHMGGRCSIARVTAPAATVLTNITSSLVRWEEIEIRGLFESHKSAKRIAEPHLDEAALLDFCRLVRALCSTLATAQFYFLFDDAGDPNIPQMAQHVLNDLVTSSNSVFCIKLSAERFSYDLRDASGRTLEETHDFTSFDITTAYATESGFAPSREAVKTYFAQIMKRRLDYWHYPNGDIGAYLGDQMKSPEGMITVRELVRRLAAGAKNAYYSGWEVVWQLADKTPRSLIEFVSEIFAHAQVRPDDGRSTTAAASVIPIRAIVQDRAIRAVSNRRLRSLEFIPGEVTVKGKIVPVGKHMYLCATSFGNVSHKYLVNHSVVPQKRRIDERLALERNDTALLDDEGGRILQLLVRYGIFDDSVLNVSFDDGQKKPVYVFNRVFCPAFSISFRRDAHLRLSVRKLEMFLLEPATFARIGTGFLRGSAAGRTERRLWEEGDTE